MNIYSFALYLLVVVISTASFAEVLSEEKIRNDETSAGARGRSMDDAEAPTKEILYFTSNIKVGFASARSDCEQTLGPDATLLMIETEEELQKVIEFLRKSNDTAATFWIGAGYDMNTQTFNWENGVTFGKWVPWDHGHPNSRTSITKIAINTVSGVKFITQFQTQTTRYICEVHL